MKRGDNGFNSYRRESDDQHQRNGHHTSPSPSLRNWQAEAEGYSALLTDEAREELARQLGLPLTATDAEPRLGFIHDDGPAPCWTYPLFDGTGRMVGIGRRFIEPVSLAGGNPTNKAWMSGSTPALTYSPRFKERPGPIVIVEGFSDRLALEACGLAVVGRPNNMTGAEMLATLLRDVPAERPIVILAEHDLKPDGTWPGKTGAEHVAAKLGAALQRPVRVAFPPEGSKDARAWVQEIAAGQGEAEDWPSIGAEILREIESQHKPRFKFVDSATFFATEYKIDWLIPGVFVERQPMVIAGPSKGMKTSVALDAAISLASGTAFLGKFPLHRRRRVAMVSGESGEAVLKETGLRQARAKGIEPASLRDHLIWSFKLPILAREIDVKEFTAELLRLNVEVLFLDPLYLCLGDIDAKSMFEMGAALSSIAECLLKAGVTPAICHHANKLLAIGEPMELSHLAYSGLEQFARQFVLLNRRESYRSDGNHELWMRVGGSAGHGGLWGVQIHEGITQHDGSGRVWEVDVKTQSELTADGIDRQEQEREHKVRQKTLQAEAKILEAIDAEVSTGAAGATKGSIRRRTGFGAYKVAELVQGLVDANIIESVEVTKAGGNGANSRSEGFRRVSE